MANTPTGTLSIAATFTIDPVVSSLSFMLEQAGIQLDIRLAPYHQIFQELLSDSGLLASNATGANVILIRIEDFIRDTLLDEAALATIVRTGDELATALASFAARAKVTSIVSILSSSPRAARFTLALEAANAKLVERMHSTPGVVLLSSDDIESVFAGDRFDNTSDEIAHIPFTQDFFASLSIGIARKVHAALVPPHKVLALDCDNTLWRGVVGEDGIDGLEITPAFASLHRFAIEAHSRGTLICLLSKNSERDVLDVFRCRSDMLLQTEHVVAHRINWHSKPQNIASLAKELNLGLESFVFVDDNPVECAFMRSELPQVVTLQLPPESEIDAFLRNLWVFDKISVTDEDLRRTDLYKQDAARHAFEAETTNIGDFFASLGVAVDIRSPNDSEWARLAQLTQRTNQFNFSTKRRTEAELRSIARTDAAIFSVNVKDRFGDYGLVGLIIATFQADRLLVDTFLLSCRVLGRGVEHAIMRELGSVASARNLKLIALPFVPTAKNEPAHAFVESVADQFRILENSTCVYLIPSSTAALITHRPGFDPDAVIKASRKSEKTATSDSSALAGSDRYARLARQLTSGSQVNALVNYRSSRPRTLSSHATPPTNEVERRLVRLWEETLAMSDLGIDDDYFAIGGSSLAAARLFSEITRQFGTKLPLTTILTSPTVRTLAQQMLKQDVDVAADLVELKGGSPTRGSLRHLFFVHDGDGETLLYTNLAQRLPDNVAVFGINPRRAPGVPLAHTRVEDMASYYISQVRQKQPSGPYLLGGMCAGGVIAYEMAHQLLLQEERVDLILLLDAATPQAHRRRHLIAKNRYERFSSMVNAQLTAVAPFQRRTISIASVASRKMWNALRWEVLNKANKWSVAARFRLLQTILTHQKAWPLALPALTVRQIYERAEATYVPKPVEGSNVILVRASAGRAGDTPYLDLYSDKTLGWGTIVADLNVIDVEGGHYSMLQEAHVEYLAQAIKGFLYPRRVDRNTTYLEEPA